MRNIGIRAPEFRQQAIDQFIELIKRDDELHTFEPLGRAFFVLGSLYDDRPEDADLAIYAYKTGLEHAPSPQAQNNLGLLYLQKNMIDKAAEEFKQAIQRYPDYESPYHNLAKLYFYERDEEILKDLQAWLEGGNHRRLCISSFTSPVSLMECCAGRSVPESLFPTTPHEKFGECNRWTTSICISPSRTRFQVAHRPQPDPHAT